MENLAKAIIAVMNEVSNIEKSMTVGAGTKGAYKGVSDKDVKNIVGKAMAKHGLCIMPIEVEAKTQIDRWEEEDAWSKTVPKEKKTKQSVFVETTCKYLLLHESGESQVISGYGNGVDSQDKAAGKATTYSLKNALLYTFMIPTGDLEDTDKTHSDDIPVPQNTAPQAKPTLPWLNKSDTPNFNNVVTALKGNFTMADIRKKWSVSKETQKELEDAVNQTA